LLGLDVPMVVRKFCEKFLDPSLAFIKNILRGKILDRVRKRKKPRCREVPGLQQSQFAPRLRQAGPRPPHLVVQGSGQVGRCPNLDRLAASYVEQMEIRGAP
jgi:hypothetical protein